MTDVMMKTTLMDVTPELATKWLEGNVHNREIRQGVVARYAADMKAGEWMLTHQGIAFDDEGTLIDGQHRLWAVIESGVTVRTLVTRGADLASQLVIDDHLKRTALDAFVLSDKSLSLTNRHVAAAKLMLQVTQDLRPAQVSKQLLLEFVERYNAGVAWVIDNVLPKGWHRGISQAAIVAVCAQAYYAGADQDRLRRFGEILHTGMTTDKADTAAILLRNWLQARTAGAGGYGVQLVVYNKAMRALKAFMDREPLTVLYEAREQLFPLVKGEGRARPARRRRSA
jgi:hypothetical protein